MTQGPGHVSDVERATEDALVADQCVVQQTTDGHSIKRFWTEGAADRPKAQHPTWGNAGFPLRADAAI